MKALRGFVGSRPSPPTDAQPSTSAVFPKLRKLDLHTDQSQESPLLTLTLSAPSFLDAVVKDEFSDTPLYIIETNRDRTGIYRCETENITSIAKVQWPSRSKMLSANAVALSGISVQMHDGRLRPAEEFLKFGSLFTSRKFHIPHHPHSLKWKRIGTSYTCTCASVKSPIAILQSAHLSTPPRLRVYSSLLQDDMTRNQSNYGGVPHALLDYLIVTSLILVTDIEEYLHRPGQDVGAAKSAMEAFLPPALRNKRNGRGSSASTDSRSPTNSSENVSGSNLHSFLTDDARSIDSEVPSTPSSTISQYHPYSFFRLAAPDPDVPPVPEVPPEHQASVPPVPPRSSTLPPLPTLGRTPTIRRRLPQPPGQATPITPAQTEQLWGLPGAQSTPDLRLPADSPNSSISVPSPLPATPQHQQHLRQGSDHSRSSISSGRRQLPPQRQPPQLPIPLPPKLRDDLARSIPPPTAPSDGMFSANETSREAGEPGSSIHEGGGGAGGVGSGQPQGFLRRFSGIDDPSTMRTSLYELPPPAYDAIDFSLPRPPVLGGEGYQSFSVNSRLPPEQIS